MRAIEINERGRRRGRGWTREREREREKHVRREKRRVLPEDAIGTSSTLD